MQRLACNEVLGDLPFELDAVGAVLGHGFHPLKARQPWSIPNLLSVHRQGRTPNTDHRNLQPTGRIRAPERRKSIARSM
jgi:hypothetical protein